MNTRWLLAILIVAVLVLYVFPYAYLILTSLKPPYDAIAIPPTVFPRQVTFESYQRLLTDPSITRAFANSLAIATMSTVLSLLLAVPAAYGITRYRTGLGYVFIIGALATRMVPFVSVAIPFTAVMASVGLTDTHIAVALAHTTINLPLALFLMASFFEGLPPELEEAAQVDGCSRFGALVRIVVPVSAGGIAVTALFAFLASWNEFLFALLLTRLEAVPATVAIAQFKTQYGVEWGAMTALATMYSLPVVLLALVMQRRIVAGLTLGGVKG